MASFTVTIDASNKAGDGSCTIRLATGVPGKYVTLVIKDGETITTDDAETAKALGSITGGQKAVTPLAQTPAKATHEPDKLPKQDIPKASLQVTTK